MNDRYGLRQLVGDARRLERFCRFLEPAKLVVGGEITPHWMLDGSSFWYVAGPPHDISIVRVDGESGATAPLFDVVRTRKALAAVLGREPPNRGLPFDSVIELGAGRYQFAFEGAHYILGPDYSIEATEAPVAAHVPRTYRRPMFQVEPVLVTEVPSPDRRLFASVKDGNIVLRDTIDDRTVPLTTDGSPDFAWDIEAPRSKLSAGIQWVEHLLDPWSPEGDRLFAMKVDRRAVLNLPYLRYLKREVELCFHKMQRAGGPMDIAYPHVIDVRTKRVRRFDLGNTEDQFFMLIGWLPDRSEVLFTRHSRDFKQVDVLAGNANDGSVRTVIAERGDTFVALQHDVIFFGDNHVTVLDDGSGLIWRSSRSGWNHLYLYAMDGTLSCALTQGDFPVIDVVAVDRKGGWVYFTAHHDQSRPYDTHLCRVRLTGQGLQRLTPLDGQNKVSMSPAKTTFLTVNSRPDRPFSAELHACDGRHLATVQKADISALKECGYVASEQFTVMAADGKTVLWGVMHKPADFDPAKQYPLIDHLYAGPQVSMVNHHFGLGEHCHETLDRALAQLGYIVISLDARGTPERSKQFQDVVYRHWGRHEIADHAAAIEQLARRFSFIDRDRVGVWGHSWGGYFTVRALMQAPQTFHVGVASAPGSDVYDAMLYEPYLDLPHRCKAAYDYASNHERLGEILGKLMLIVGSADSYIYSNTLKVVHRLIQAGIDHELVVLPDAGHSFFGKDEDYFIRKLVTHFEIHLKSRNGAQGDDRRSIVRAN